MSAFDFGVGSEFDSGFDIGFGSGFDIMFSIVPIIVMIGFIMVFVLIGVSLYKEWTIKKKNDNSPRITVPAKVVSKRTDVSHRHSGRGSDFHSTRSYSRYYVTFEVESGDRMELNMSGSDFGMLVEGDEGRLTFQGTRYISFER